MLLRTRNVYLHLTSVCHGFLGFTPCLLLGKLTWNTIIRVWFRCFHFCFANGVTFRFQPLILRGVLPPQFKIVPERWRIWKTIVLVLGWHCFRCDVSFREGQQHTSNGWAPGIFLVESDIPFNTIIVFLDSCVCFRGVYGVINIKYI